MKRPLEIEAPLPLWLSEAVRSRRGVAGPSDASRQGLFVLFAVKTLAQQNPERSGKRMKQVCP